MKKGSPQDPGQLEAPCRYVCVLAGQALIEGQIAMYTGTCRAGMESTLPALRGQGSHFTFFFIWHSIKNNLTVSKFRLRGLYVCDLYMVNQNITFICHTFCYTPVGAGEAKVKPPKECGKLESCGAKEYSISNHWKMTDWKSFFQAHRGKSMSYTHNEVVKQRKKHQLDQCDWINH